MKTESKTQRPRPEARRALRLLWLPLWLCTAGCSLLEDEFTWLDRAAPASLRAPDRPLADLAERP